MRTGTLWKKTASLAVAVSMLLTANLSSASAEGRVDWEQQTVIATGRGIAPPTAVSAAQARMLARRAAVADGYRVLAEQVNDVQVDAESTVENMMVLSDVVRTKVSACIKGARVVDEQITPDGVYEVKLEVPMYGVSNSLAAAVLPRPMVRQPFPAPTPEADEPEAYENEDVFVYDPYASVHVEVNIGQNAPSLRNGADGTIVSHAADYYPYGTQNYPHYQPPQISSYPTAEPSKGKKPKKQKEKKSEAIVGDYTSLVIDCTGLALRPAMSPVIKNEQGGAIYGASNLDYDLVSTRGMASYWRDLDVSGLARAGDKPLTVKCASLSDNNVNPVLTVADANRVLRENEQSHFLDNLNVILVR